MVERVVLLPGNISLTFPRSQAIAFFNDTFYLFRDDCLEGSISGTPYKIRSIPSRLSRKEVIGVIDGYVFVYDQIARQFSVARPDENYELIPLPHAIPSGFQTFLYFGPGQIYVRTSRLKKSLKSYRLYTLYDCSTHSLKEGCRVIVPTTFCCHFADGYVTFDLKGYGQYLIRVYDSYHFLSKKFSLALNCDELQLGHCFLFGNYLCLWFTDMAESYLYLYVLNYSKFIRFIKDLPNDKVVTEAILYRDNIIERTTVLDLYPEWSCILIPEMCAVIASVEYSTNFSSLTQTFSDYSLDYYILLYDLLESADRVSYAYESLLLYRDGIICRGNPVFKFDYPIASFPQSIPAGLHGLHVGDEDDGEAVPEGFVDVDRYDELRLMDEGY
ncbi:MAG: hypothetical protein KatS3mg087_0019 [Patescibacteria group bacterium]|nr:MAG: hypothetical protein KatS3mg087_0019 [Patescibacteria group bacterium]